ncbi:serine hydrolase [Microbacterium deminutum]|uniref:Serine hydrolase n=1 Tax=Microbacterium deminutum TaxID=344164 RepID=A0ABP5BTI3_9MICO
MPDVDGIREFIRSEQARFAVPGIAVAVVHDGTVLLCEGFGEADLEAGEPVGVDTHFPIASDTKAFTAATLCLLADAGRVDLDAPVRDILPWFEMHDPHATALVTPRDLLSHRTGLPRHDMVWFGDSDLPLQETTRRLRHLPMSQPLRTSWDYNNLCYIAAGHLTEVVTGMPWHEAVRTHLLDPLGMTDTVFSAQDPSVRRLAQPYRASGDGMSRLALPAQAAALKAGPAGGLVSTIADLARWLTARLGHRDDVLPASTLDQLHCPAMIGGISLDELPEVASLGYGLGCQVESYRGTRLIHHGGNIPGFSSDVAIVPDTDIGIAVLTNLDSSYLRLPLIYGVVDLLRGEPDAGLGARIHELQTALMTGHTEARARQHARADDAPPSRDLDGFAGTYSHPAYGELSIRVAGDQLVPDFHDAADRILLEHRGHDTWDLVFVDNELDCRLVFTQGLDGRIAGLSVDLEPAVAPAGFARRHEPASAALLAAMVGAYRMGPATLTIRMRGAELVAHSDILGDTALVGAGGTDFTCAALPGIGVTAELDAVGEVSQIVVDQVGIFLPAAL